MHFPILSFLCECIYNCDQSRSDSGGYEYDFVDTVPPKYNCNICLKVLRDAQLTVCCGQHYCDTCLKEWLNSKTQEGKNTCPHCREENLQSVRNKEKIREINEFKIRCTHKVKGCKWVDELGALKHHLVSDNGCDYVIVRCGNSVDNTIISSSSIGSTCGAVIERCHLTYHHKYLCFYRQYTCQYCGYVDTYDAITGSGEIRNRDSKIVGEGNHYSQCIEYPLKCPNECGAENIKPKDMKTHRENCPLECFDCRFQHIGCTVGKIPRKKVINHYQEMTQGHLVLLLQSHQDLAQKNEELSLEIAHKHEELVHKHQVLGCEHEELVLKHQVLGCKHEELVHKNGELNHKIKEFEKRIQVLEAHQD